MRSIITRFSIVNARGGSVSQDIEFLEVDEARKLLFASTMKDERHIRDNINHHEFPLDLFNIQPSLLTNVLYGENGSGKTTYLKLMQDAGSFIQSIFKTSQNRGTATKEDLMDWHKGNLPRSYQHPQNQNNIKFEDLNDNLVVESIRSTLKPINEDREIMAKAQDYFLPMQSSFSLEMQGVFAPPRVWQIDHSGDMKFSCQIKPVSDMGFAWEDNKRLKNIKNFDGFFYMIHLRLDGFKDDYKTEISESPDNALLDIKKEATELRPYWAEHNIPILVHPTEGVLPLGRTVINPEIGVSDEFKWEDEDGHRGDFFVDAEDSEGKANPEFSLFRNLVVGQLMGDLDPIEKIDIFSPDCEFFRHAALFVQEGFPSDFFLCPTEQIKAESFSNPIQLPSMASEAHFRLYEDYQLDGAVDGFDDENPYSDDDVWWLELFSGNMRHISDLIQHIRSAYSFSPEYTPTPLSFKSPKPGRFSDRFVNNEPSKYLHLMYTLNPPERAIDGVVESITIGSLRGNLELQLTTLEDIYDHLNSTLQMPWYTMRRRFKNDSDTGQSPYEDGINYFKEKYASLGFDEAEQEGAAKAEIKNFIVERLDYLWFEGMPKEIARQKSNMMIELVRTHVGLTFDDPDPETPTFDIPSLSFSPDNIWSLKSKKKIKFEHLSSGQRNLFSLISILGSEGDGTILIDEPELSLHMDWQLAMKDIVQCLVNHSKRQVFIASHSPDVILKFDDRSFPLLGEEVSDIDA